MRSIFVDANVLIAGADSRSGASRAVLMVAEIGLFRLVVCPQVLDEAERNLRQKLPQALPLFTEIMAVLDLEIVPDPPPAAYQRWLDIIEAKDAPILEAAVQSGADRFLTLNTKDFTAEVAAQTGLLLFRLELFAVPDLPIIELKVGGGDIDYRPLNALSIGQRCTALLGIVVGEFGHASHRSAGGRSGQPIHL
jgi:predicted nucleic acid-binding protein